MVLRRFLGLGGSAAPGSNARAGRAGDDAETATVRRIVAQLDALEPEDRRYLAGFAYVLSRAAHADLDIAEDETSLMERLLMEIGGLPQPQAVLAVEIAKNQTQLYGGTEDYLVTREFAARATDEQRIALMESCFAIVAADHSISAEEYAELTQISSELGLTQDQLNRIRREYRDNLDAIKRMREIPGAASSTEAG